jgi:hypothetical protein
MARRLPFGPPRSPRVLGVVAAAVLVVGLVVTGRLLNMGSSEPHPPASPVRAISTQAPYRIGNSVECPPAWPVLAAANHLSYPAGHPVKPPPTAAAVACYHTAAQAATAGYAVAPLPPGALEVGGIYLTPTSQRFRTSCQQVADRLGVMIPCPRLLPTWLPGVPAPQLCEPPPTCQRGQPLLFTQQDFAVPFGYVGAPGGNGLLFIVAAPAHDATSQLGLQCQHERRLATLTVQGTGALLATCADDPEGSWFGGSVLLHWSQQDTLVVVGVMGYSEVNQRLAVALANHLHLVLPGS